MEGVTFSRPNIGGQRADPHNRLEKVQFLTVSKGFSWFSSDLKMRSVVEASLTLVC